MIKYTYIRNNQQFQAFLRSFKDRQSYTIALDLEAENNRHAYGETLCLLQIYDGTNQIIIDTLKVDIESVKLLCENRDILKVMYDASSDLSLLKNAYNIDIKSILDLRPAVELLSYKKQDLHSVIGFELGIVLENKERFQRQNWLVRPISPEAIEYALNDVIHLIALKEALLKKLYEQKLLDVFWLKNLKIQSKDYTRDPQDKYYKISGYQGLQDDEKATFRMVFDIREEYARRYNMPAAWVINKADLINIGKNINIINAIQLPIRFRDSLIQEVLRKVKGEKIIEKE